MFNKEYLREIIKAETSMVFENFFNEDEKLSEREIVEFYEGFYGAEELNESVKDYLVSLGATTILTGHSLATFGDQISSDMAGTMVFSSLLLAALLGKVGSLFSGEPQADILEDDLLQNVAQRDKLLAKLRETDNPATMKSLKRTIKTLTREQMRIGQNLKRAVGGEYRGEQEYGIIQAAERGGLTGIKGLASKEIR